MNVREASGAAFVYDGFSIQIIFGESSGNSVVKLNLRAPFDYEALERWVKERSHTLDDSFWPATSHASHKDEEVELAYRQARGESGMGQTLWEEEERQFWQTMGVNRGF